MKKIYIAIISLLLSDVGLQAQEQDTVRLTLKEAINLAQMQSVDAAVALNELKTAYWEYRTQMCIRDRYTCCRPVTGDKLQRDASSL